MKKRKINNITKSIISLVVFTLLISFTACRDDVEMILSEYIQLEHPRQIDGYQGFYLLNEGNMGSNKATLDFFNFETGEYMRNIYAERNPNVPKELGDVGNDMGIYDGKLYVVVNVSNKVEVMDAKTTERIGQIDIPNCRFIKFHEGYAYVTSYAGPVTINPNYEQIGYVAKINTTTHEQEDICLVGFQPDELEIVDGKIYVANSGGYMGVESTSDYERTVSVIDIASFEEEKRIDVAYNLEHIKADKRGNLWVSSRGDYEKLPSRLFYIDIELQQVTDTIDVAASNYWIDDDLLYVIGTAYSHNTQYEGVSYYIVDTKTREVVKQQIVTDGIDKEFEKPYGIMVDPETKDIYITDAGNYVTPGVLYCFDKNGKKKWSVRVGNSPAHFALLPV